MDVVLTEHLEAWQPLVTVARVLFTENDRLLNASPKADIGAIAAKAHFVRTAVVQQTQVQRQLQREFRSKPNVCVTGAKGRF